MLISFFCILFGLVMIVVLIKVVIYRNNKLKRRNLKITPDDMEGMTSLANSMPEEMVEIHMESVTWFGIEKESKLVFKCKVCGQVLRPQVGSDGCWHRDSWQCPNGCKPGK